MESISRYNTGNYVFCADEDRDIYYLTQAQHPDNDDTVKSYDRVLHQSLQKILRESFPSSSGQIKKYRRVCQHDVDRNSTIKRQILEQEPFLSRHFWSEELGKLSFLWIAVLGAYYDSAELLVCSGADVNKLFRSRHPQVIDKKWTVLHVLIQMNPSPENERLIRLIADHGADLQARDSKGRTVLHLAVMGGRVQMAEMLLEKGAGLNVADDNGERPLLAAARGSKAVELVPLLLKHGADVSARDSEGCNALHLLTQNPNVKQPVAHLARALIEKGCSLDDRIASVNQYQLIHQAVLAGNNELVELYLDHGADVNARAYDDSYNGVFPLHLAAGRPNSAAVLTTLLKRGADIDNSRTSHENRTALHLACRSYLKKNMQILLYAGADVLVADRNGETAFDFILHLSYGSPEYPITRLMLKGLALKTVRQPSFVLKCGKLFKRYPKLWNFYQDCIEKVKRMKVARFAETCTLFELLAKCHCRIAELMRNPEFEINFKKYDLKEFSTYAQDVVRAFELARNHHDSVLEQEDVINEAVNDGLPYAIVRRVTHYICNCCESVK